MAIFFQKYTCYNKVAKKDQLFIDLSTKFYIKLDLEN